MPSQPNPSADGTPPPDPNKPQFTHSLLNQRQLDDLNKAANVARAAQKEGRAAALAEREIAAADITALDDAVQAATKKAGVAVDDTNAKKQDLQAATTAQDGLIAAIADIQKAAKQKYVGDKIAQAAYYVGQDLRRNQNLLKAASLAILNKLDPQGTNPDTLPGIKAPQLAKLTAARQAYLTARGDVTDDQSDATTVRQELVAMLADIYTLRAKLQYAADAVWPHTDPTNAGIRKEFELPADRPVK